MLEVAIWIGVALAGMAALGVIEYVRSNSYIKAHRGDIVEALPIAALALLVFTAAAVSLLFFFLLFLSHIWQYGVIGIAAIYIFLVARIRKDNPFRGLMLQPQRAAGGGGVPGAGPIRRVAGLVAALSGAALLIALMIPFAATGFILFGFLRILADAMGPINLLAAAIVAGAAIALLYRVIFRRRPPPS